jgi:hypothetical protein
MKRMAVAMGIVVAGLLASGTVAPRVAQAAPGFFSFSVGGPGYAANYAYGPAVPYGVYGPPPMPPRYFAGYPGPGAYRGRACYPPPPPRPHCGYRPAYGPRWPY